MKLRILFIAMTLVGFLVARSAEATVNITFTNGDTFDGDVAGSLAGPFTDTATPLTAEILTQAVGPGGSVVNTVATMLGINAPTADTADAFNSGENWTFTWSQNYQFVGIDLVDYNATDGDFAFSVQSPELIGAAITPGSANVVFNGVTGTFTFDADTAADDFTASDLYGVGTIPTIHNTRSLTFAYTSTDPNGASVTDMSFNLLIPEPSSAVLLGLSALVLLRRKH